jgi:hypothetical protein
MYLEGIFRSYVLPLNELSADSVSAYLSLRIDIAVILLS